MNDPTPTRRGAEMDQVRRTRDAYITFGFGLARMGGDLDDTYRQMMSREVSDEAVSEMFGRIVAEYGDDAWNQAVNDFTAALP